VGVGQLAMRGQEYVVALKPCGRGMLLETLRYSDEVNKAASYFREIEDAQPDPDLLDLASTLIDKKTGKFDADEFHNRYVDALKGLIEEKRKKKGELVIQDPDNGDKAPKSNVIDLMAALKKSLGDDARNDNTAPPKKPAAKKAAPARKSAAAKKEPAAPAKKAVAGGRKRA
jgi:DNA end-binding protein Ku